MPKQIIMNISNCWDCPHKAHTGSFTKGGAKECCNHPNIYSKYESCFDRILPLSATEPQSKHKRKIPNWCPL